MSTNPNTGLPELPKNYFWRVEEVWLTSVCQLQLQLRKRNFLELSRCILAVNLHCPDGELAYQGDLTEDMIYDAAVRLAAEFYRSRSTSSLLADYPPKKLS